MQPIVKTSRELLQRALPKRDAWSHKGEFGRVFIISGSVGYTGAPVLAATAALRTGSGLIFVMVPQSVYGLSLIHILQERPLSAAERGTATHLFLQFADYHKCQSLEGIEQELVRLTQKQFLTPKQAVAVNQSAVYTLFTSELGQRILRSSAVKREMCIRDRA